MANDERMSRELGDIFCCGEICPRRFATTHVTGDGKRLAGGERFKNDVHAVLRDHLGAKLDT